MISPTRELYILRSMYRLDWHTAHFGHPGSVRFYTSGINDRYVRVFWSNKRREEDTGDLELDGRWVDVFFAVANNARDGVLKDLVAIFDPTSST